MDEEVPYDSEYTQIMSFSYQTQCAGVECLLNEIKDPEPQTLALGIGLAFVLVFAVYRRGQNAGVMNESQQNWIENEFDLGVKNLEPIVEFEHEEDDDLELLDELDDL